MAVRAELAKLMTLPSLWTTAVLTWAVTLLLRLVELPGSVLVHTQAGLLVFGVLAAVQEHDRGGQIGATLLAMPRRLPLAVAKATALLLVTVPVAVLVAVTAGEPGGAGYLVLATAAGSGFGMVLRNGVGAAGAVLGTYLVAVPLIRALLPGASTAHPPGETGARPPGETGARPPGETEARPPGETEARLPDAAGWLPNAPDFDLAAVIWAVAALTVAAVIFHRRDA
jgi:hypothetical protein